MTAFFTHLGFMPTLSPDSTSAYITAFYSENQATIRFNMITFNLYGIMRRMATHSHVFHLLLF